MLPSVNKINNLKEFLFEIRFFSLSLQVLLSGYNSSSSHDHSDLKKFSAMPDSVRQLSRFVRTIAPWSSKAGVVDGIVFLCLFLVFPPKTGRCRRRRLASAARRKKVVALKRQWKNN